MRRTLAPQHENAGGEGEPLDYREGLKRPEVSRIKTPIGVIVDGRRVGQGARWCFFPDGDYMKTFGKRRDAVEYVVGLLTAKGLVSK